MRWLEEHEIGLQFYGSVIPLVSAACLFDLGFAGGKERPDAQMGYLACANAQALACECGNVGAGAGATVGKYLGFENSMKAGLGLASVVLGDLVVTAVVAVNALGSVIDRKASKILAGTLDPRQPTPTLIDPYEALSLLSQVPAGNTTIGCILTNAEVTKSQATNIANATHDGYARAIEPVHTSNDGDTVFVLSSAQVAGNADVVSALSALAMERAIHNSCLEAKAVGACLASRNL
jgi:L-aminopeptidase/D-esterase-like protein